MSVSILSARSASSTRSSRSCLSAVSKLSDRELLTRVTTLARRERETTLSILLHLNEVYRRRLYLSLGYRSLFDYCVRHLGYSRSAAGRRFQTARCLREFPEVYGMLEKGEVSLSTITLVASILDKENKADILDRIRGKSQEAVEGIVARFRPLVPQRDKVKPVCVRVPAKTHPDPRSLIPNQSRSGIDCAVDGHPGNGTDVPQSTGTTTPSGEAPPGSRLEQKLLIQFTASKGFMAKYEALCALVPNSGGHLSFEKVFETLIDDYLDRHSPEKRVERRKNKKAKTKTKTRTKTETKTKPKKTDSKTSVQSTRAKNPKRSRHIPTAVRDKVFIRDQGKCTYVGSSGKQCGATRGLQVDHITPYARGGTHAVSNLRLLCAQHNRLEAENAFGRDVMQQYTRRE